MGKEEEGAEDAIARIAERAAFDDLASSSSVVYPEYETDAAREYSDYEYDESDVQVPELSQPSQTINTFVPAPTGIMTEQKCK